MIPTSTYRIQFNKDFTFKHLDSIIDYLQQLGITTIYASPIFMATPGSMHGYDVTDPHQINPEIGTLEELRNISGKLKERGMNWLQDIVPNHMAFNVHNWRLMDVLERGQQSPYANYFDVNWNHHKQAFKGKIMVPFLGAPLEKLIREGVVKLVFDGNGLRVAYYDNEYPLNIGSFKFILHQQPSLQEGIAMHLEALSTLTGDAYQRTRNNFYQQVFQQHGEEMKRALEGINNSTEALFEVLREQHFILVPHYESNNTMNYRRFFTVNDLICLRMEDEAVFSEYHRFIHTLYQEGIFTGLRIDHIDGLHNPDEYIERLRALFGKDCYIIAEKILESKEKLPANWQLHGTSGYEFLSYTNHLLTYEEGAEKIKQHYNTLESRYSNYDEVVFNNKKRFLEQFMNGELENVTKLLIDLKLIDEHDEDTVKQSLAAFMVALPVYRTYPAKLPLSEADLQVIEEASEKAHERNPHLSSTISRIVNLFRAQQPNTDQHLYFLNRLMQFTGPLAAKGVEDTTFYNYNALISHNEVGDAPCKLGISIQEFHRKMIERQQRNRYSLNTTSTHDTKRGEDGRLRINLLAEQSEDWISNVKHWRSLNAKYKLQVDRQDAPIANDEYFIYQSLVNGLDEDGNWSEECSGRLKAYMLKALREGKDKSSWHEPNEAYENASMQFIDAIMHKQTEFYKSFSEFHQKLRSQAWRYYLLQAAIKYTAPGIPDTYQGCEMLDFSYVDPDNRRPVDYPKRQQALQQNGTPEDATTELLKFNLVHKLLQLRKDNAELFLEGSYEALDLSNHNLLGYMRRYNNKAIVVFANLSALHVSEELNIAGMLPGERVMDVVKGQLLQGRKISFDRYPLKVLMVE